MDTLRNRLIRLAYENPNMREVLLPVLQSDDRDMNKESGRRFDLSKMYGEMDDDNPKVILERLRETAEGSGGFARSSVPQPARVQKAFMSLLKRLGFKQVTSGRNPTFRKGREEFSFGGMSIEYLRVPNERDFEPGGPPQWHEKWDDEDVEESWKYASNLRSATIKLAHAKPELRPYLLPLLQEDQ